MLFHEGRKITACCLFLPHNLNPVTWETEAVSEVLGVLVVIAVQVE